MDRYAKHLEACKVPNRRPYLLQITHWGELRSRSVLNITLLRKFGIVFASVFVLGQTACSGDPGLVAVKETGFQCLNDACIDPNGNLICFVTEKYLYDDGTQSEGKRRELTGPYSCGSLPKDCWKYEGQPWKCGDVLNDIVIWTQP